MRNDLRHFALSGAVVVAVLLPATAARCATVEVRPTLLVINPSQHTAVLSLENHEARPVLYQVRIYRWRQEDDEQQLDPTDEVIASPPMVTIAEHGTQIVRVGLRAGEIPGAEQTYRLILEEVPMPDAPHAAGLNINLRLSLPLFVRPQEDLPAAQLEGELRLAGSKATAIIHNRGTYTQRVIGVSMKEPLAAKDMAANHEDRLEVNRLTYIQPGKAAAFAFSLPYVPDDFHTVTLSAQIDEGRVDLSAPVTAMPVEPPSTAEAPSHGPASALP